MTTSKKIINGGGNDDNKKDKEASQTGPVEPGELQIPQGLGPILGGAHEKEENKTL